MPRAATLLIGLLLGILPGGRGLAQDPVLDGDHLLDPLRLLTIHITMREDDWDALRIQRRHGSSFYAGAPIDDPFTWFRADINIDGTWIRSVGVRKKGLFGSMDPVRPSLKVKFNEFAEQDPVRGLNRLTLNNNKQDTSLVSQYLTYKVFRDAGVHAPRCSLARVSVNGDDLGIYTHVESIKKPFLARTFGDDRGNLYEGTLTDFHPRTLKNFSVKTHKSTNDLSDLARIAALFEGREPLDLEEVEKLLDVDEFLRFWALEAMVQFRDGYSSNQNNYYFYVDPTSGQGTFIPWGADACWSGRSRRGRTGSTAVFAKSILANRLFHTDGMSDRYRNTLILLLDEVWKEEELIAEIDRLERLVRSDLHRTQRDTDEAMDDVRAFLRARRDQLEGEIARWPPPVPPDPVPPTYTIPLGTLRGSFQTKWDKGEADPPTRIGKAEVEVIFEGAPVPFRRIGASAYAYNAPRGGFGGGRGGDTPPRINLAIAGARESDGEVLSFVVSVDQAAFEEASGEPIPVTGSFRVGDAPREGPFGRGQEPRKSVFGEITFTRAGVQRGKKVVGTLDLTIAEVHGGR